MSGNPQRARVGPGTDSNSRSQKNTAISDYPCIAPLGLGYSCTPCPEASVFPFGFVVTCMPPSKFLPALRAGAHPLTGQSSPALATRNLVQIACRTGLGRSPVLQFAKEHTSRRLRGGDYREYIRGLRHDLRRALPPANIPSDLRPENANSKKLGNGAHRNQDKTNRNKHQILCLSICCRSGCKSPLKKVAHYAIA